MRTDYVNKTWFAPVLMFVITAVCSTVLLGISVYTRPRVLINEKLMFQRAVVSVIPSVDLKSLRAEEINRFFNGLEPPDEQNGNAYVYMQNGKIAAYALSFEGQGFWAPIKGVIGVFADGKTVSSVIFYEQNETPGLGAQITSAGFREQFKNKTLGSEMPISIKRTGETLDQSSVYAVTGATQTSTRLEKIINDAVNRWRSKLK